MAKGTKKKAGPDLSAVIEVMGLDWLIQQAGAKQVIEQLGAKRVIEQLGMWRVIKEGGGLEQLCAELTPEERKQLKDFLEK